MLPLLRHGDIVFYKKTNLKQACTNDIILVQKNNQAFTHRVIYKTGRYLITKGDNNLESDGRIYPRQIIAKVTQVKRNGKLFNPEDIYLFQSTHYLNEIIKIKQVFEKAGIEYVFLKGLPLHLYFEKTHPRRIYADCDVLLHKKEYIKAKEILEKHKYKEIKNDIHTQGEKNS